MGKKEAFLRGFIFFKEIRDDYSSIVAIFLRFCEETDLLLTVESLREWIEYLEESGYSASYIRFCFFGVRRRLIQYQQTLEFESVLDLEISRNRLMYELSQIKLPKRNSKYISSDKLLSIDDVKKICLNSDPQTAIWIEFLFVTGLRISEMINIQKKMRGKVRIITKVAKDVYQIRIIGKGGKERKIKISAALRRRVEDVFHGKSWLFENSKGNKFHSTFIWRKIKEAGWECLERSISPHCLRHSFASLNVKSNKDIKLIGEYMGHGDPSTTLTYLHSGSDKSYQFSEFSIWRDHAS